MSWQVHYQVPSISPYLDLVRWEPVMEEYDWEADARKRASDLEAAGVSMVQVVEVKEAS